MPLKPPSPVPPGTSADPGALRAGRAARVAALFLLGCVAWAAAPPGIAETPRVLQLAPAQVRALGVQTVELAPAGAGAAAVLRVPGLVVVPPQQQRVLAAPVAGLVESLAVSPGDAVRPGQVLVQLRSAQARELQVDLLAARVQAEQAELALARDERLHAEGLIPQARLEATRAQARVAAAQREQRQDAAQLAGVPTGAGQAGGIITLSAPMAGVVLERQASVGQRVEAAAPLLRLARLSPLWLELQVPVADLPAVRTGSRVQVAGATVGRVLALGAVVDGSSQTVTVRAEVSSPALRPGQAVEAELALEGSDGQASLPAAAVLRDGPRAFVLLETAPGQFKAQDVTVLRASAGSVQLRGLPPGARVVVAGTAALRARMEKAD